MSDDARNLDLIEFPCTFPIKAIGHSHANVRLIVEKIIDLHVESALVLEFAERESGKGKFTAVTVTINAQSKAQLDNIYFALTSDKSIVFAI